MPQANDRDSTIDLTRVDFPSDRLTLAQMRKDQPELLYNNKELLNDGWLITHVRMIEMMRTEHILAKKAWTKVLGQPDPFPTHQRRSEIGYLNDDYVRYGLSSGTKQTAELVREFEAQAAQHAMLTVGQGR